MILKGLIQTIRFAVHIEFHNEHGHIPCQKYCDECWADMEGRSFKGVKEAGSE